MNNTELMERLNKAKNKDNEMAANELEARKEKVHTLSAECAEYTDVVKELIDTANALLDNDYFEKNFSIFQSEGWKHRVGFVYNRTTRHFDSMGVVNGGACGDYDFHTTGEKSYLTHHEKSDPLETDEIFRTTIEFSGGYIRRNMDEYFVRGAERFLEEINGFRNNFNNAVEKFFADKGV